MVVLFFLFFFLREILDKKFAVLMYIAEYKIQKHTMMQIATLHGGARIKANKQKILEDLLDTTKQQVQAHQTFSHCAMFFDKGRASSASSSSSLKLETFVLLFEILLLLLPCLSSFSASETDEAPVLCVQIKSSLLLSVLQLRLKCK
jgi:hypothetical protein